MVLQPLTLVSHLMKTSMVAEPPKACPPPHPPSRENVQRVVLLSHDPATRRISLRHYSIHTAPSGVTKGVKSLVAGTALPALAQLGDVSELLLKSGYGSVRTLICLLTSRSEA